MVHVWWLMAAVAAATPCKSGQWDRDVMKRASQLGETQTLEVRVVNVAPASNRSGTDAIVSTGIPQASLVRGDGCVLADEEALELAPTPEEKARLRAKLNKGSLSFRVALGVLAAGVFGVPAALFVLGAGVGALVGLVQMQANGNAFTPVQDLLVGGFLAGGVGLVLGLLWLVGGLVVIPLFFKDKERRDALEELASLQHTPAAPVVVPVVTPVEPPPPDLTLAPDVTPAPAVTPAPVEPVAPSLEAAPPPPPPPASPLNP